MKILGIDYGDIRIGISISDDSQKIALPLKTIVKKDENTIKPAIAELKEIIKINDIEKIVLGNPLNMNGTKGIRAIKTEDFKERLHRNFKKIEIILWDERLTSIQAENILKEMNSQDAWASSKRSLRPAREKSAVDQIAATLILQTFLDKENNGK